MTLLSVTLILFLIMDPFGNISTFRNLLNGYDKSKQYWITFREMGIALAAMIFFYFIGDYVLDILQVTEDTVRLASGVIIFLVAIKILFPSSTSPRANLKADEEPFIVPLAIPLVAGPGLLATIMLYSHLDSLDGILLLAILIAWLGASIVLVFSPILQRTLSNNGLMAIERLMAMVLVLLGIQRFLEGLQLFLAKH